MHASVLIQDVRSEPSGSFLVGVVKNGKLAPGMEAQHAGRLLILERMVDPVSGDALIAPIGKGTASFLFVLHHSVADLADLKGANIEFSDKRTTPVKDKLVFTPEVG